MMLTIERKPGTSVIIGNDIKIQVRWIRSNNAVRLSIDAPDDVVILREELLPDVDHGQPRVRVRRRHRARD